MCTLLIFSQLEIISNNSSLTDSYLQIENVYFFFKFIYQKKSMYVWICAVQTCVVPASVVHPS